MWLRTVLVAESAGDSLLPIFGGKSSWETRHSFWRPSRVKPRPTPPLVHLMANFRWRAMTLTRLVQLLLEALDQWWLRRDEMEAGLARLLDEQR